MLENISLSFQGIWSHKLRSVLTMLGIIIGIASIITIVSTIKGTNEQIKENLIGAGNNVVDVTLKRENSTYDLAYGGLPEGVRVIDEKTRRKLEKLDGVQEVSLYRKREWSDSVYYLGTSYSGNVMGIDTHYFDVNDYAVDYGRPFTDYDNENFRKVAILDSATASRLFGGEIPVGKVLEISGEPFTVVGVVSKMTDTSLNISSYSDYITYHTETEGGTIFIPIDDWPIIYQYDEPQYVSVKATSTDDMTIAGKNVADALSRSQMNEGSKFTYAATDLLKRASQMQSLATASSRQLIWIAGISLLVGGIGVMNIMLVSVTERTREIGLKKAIGAKKSRIRAQFLTEAAVLTSLGGIVGVAGGIVFSRVFSKMMGTRTSISIPACVVSVAFSMGIGIIFGLLPAIKASNLNPIDALRSE